MGRKRFLGIFFGGITGTITGVINGVSCYLDLASGVTAGLTAALVYVTGYYVFLHLRSVEITERSIKERDEMTRYTYLADKWYEIGIKELDNPDFTNLNKTSSYKASFKGNKLRKYESFARVCWGHVEDIYLHNWHKDIAFEPSIKRYKEFHYSWLKEPENKKRFTLDFIKYINELKID